MTDRSVQGWLDVEALKEGTAHQRERYETGELPEEELLTIVRAVLFKGFGAFERWSLSHERPKMVRQIRHDVGCDLAEFQHEVNLAPEDSTLGLSVVEERHLAAIRAMAEAAELHPWLAQTGGTVKVTALAHYIFCTKCEGDIARASAKVTITWGGRELVREYAL